MRRLCRWFIALFAILVAAAFAIAVIGTQGLFGTQPDGLAAVWLIVVGLPWTAVLTPLLLAGLPVLIGQIVAVAAPLLNIALMVWLCRRSGTSE